MAGFYLDKHTWLPALSFNRQPNGAFNTTEAERHELCTSGSVSMTTNFATPITRT